MRRHLRWALQLPNRGDAELTLGGGTQVTPILPEVILMTGGQQPVAQTPESLALCPKVIWGCRTL